MADFPDSIYDQRTLQNIPGVDFDESKPTRIYAEDVVQLGDEVTAIETVLGTGILNGFPTLDSRIHTQEIKQGVTSSQFTSDDVADGMEMPTMYNCWKGGADSVIWNIAPAANDGDVIIICSQTNDALVFSGDPEAHDDSNLETYSSYGGVYNYTLAFGDSIAFRWFSENGQWQMLYKTTL